MQKNIKLNKKGNFNDVPIALILLVGIAIFLVFLLGVSDTFFEQFNNKTQEMNKSSPQSVAFINEGRSQLPIYFDYAFLLFAVLLIFFSYIAARKIPSSPAFFVLIIIFNLFVWGLSIACSYMYERFVESSTFLGGTVNNLTFIPLILPNMLYYAIIYSFIVGIALYTKQNEGG